MQMVTAREGRGGGEEREIEETEKISDPSEEKMDVIPELISLIETVNLIGEYRRTQKKECHNLVRRMKLLLPLFEEIGDLETPVPESAIACFQTLKKAFLAAKKLLKLCHEGSKLYLALESEAVMVRFHSVNEKIRQALNDMPSDELGISDEVKEQIELMGVQLRRAKRRTDTQDMELTMDIMVVLSTKDDDRNADRASIERLANKLSLHTIEDLNAETASIRHLVKERGAQNGESTQQILYLLNKFKRIAGIEETSVHDEPVVQKTLEKSPSLAIPYAFLCPVTLEIMTDPVIVATGQTYERESIQKWLDSNHRTCPKSGQMLAHLSLAPNFALRNLILQWCEKNNFQLPNKDATVSSENSVKPNDKILNSVRNLSSNQLEVQRKAVTKIRMLSKESPESRILIADYGGIPPLVQLLSYPDSKIQEHAVTALLNLSIDESNKKLISRQEPIPAIIEVLQNGTIGAKENSAAALFSLSMLDENKIAIGLFNGIPPLVNLLHHGTIRGKKDAATALFNLSLNQANKTRAIEAGIVTPLLAILQDKNLDMVDEALSILLLLASHSDGRQEMGQLSFIETLVEFIKEGTPKNKECAAAVLLELGSNNSNLILAALQYGAYEHLVEVSNNGTNRAQRKANSLLRLISKSEQL